MGWVTEAVTLGAKTAASYEHKSQQSEGDTLPPCAKGLEQRQGLLMSKSWCSIKYIAIEIHYSIKVP